MVVISLSPSLLIVTRELFFASFLFCKISLFNVFPTSLECSPLLWYRLPPPESSRRWNKSSKVIQSERNRIWLANLISNQVTEIQTAAGLGTNVFFFCAVRKDRKTPEHCSTMIHRKLVTRRLLWFWHMHTVEKKINGCCDHLQVVVQNDKKKHIDNSSLQGSAQNYSKQIKSNK